MNPAGAQVLDAWLLAHLDSNAWGQVIVRAVPEGHELRHLADAILDASTLRLLAPADLREWADTSPTGAFRPLKSAPTLRPGWRCIAAHPDDLALALEGLYPGALGDWWAWQQGSAVATSFVDFMGRQTGIYRNARGLPIADAEAVARACCAPVACLKHRLWPVSNGTPCPTSGAAGTPPRGSIPCWEPCALLMDMARAAARLATDSRVHVPVATDDIPVLLAALEAASSLPAPSEVREADLSNPSSPRRMRLLLERLRPELSANPSSASPP